MKKLRAGSLPRLVAFLLIATLLLCLVGFSAGGWQSMSDSEEYSDKADGSNGEVDENKDKSPTEITPKYFDRLTGKEETESTFGVVKSAFVISSVSPSYALSAADIIIEFPIEDGSTRYLVFTDAVNTFGKIGSLAPSRGFLNHLVSSFGGILISNGCDDTVSYEYPDISDNHFDLLEKGGYAYTEYTHYVYSNCDLIKAGLINNGFSLTENDVKELPYEFSKTPISGAYDATVIKMRFSDSKSSEFFYSTDDEKYHFYENGVQKTDLLYDKTLSYDNVITLFADSVTYEAEGASELVIKTQTSGKGYYLTRGTKKEILWKNENGQLVFTDTEGQILAVNVGETYVGIMKSSMQSSLIIE